MQPKPYLRVFDVLKRGPTLFPSAVVHVTCCSQARRHRLLTTNPAGVKGNNRTMKLYPETISMPALMVSGMTGSENPVQFASVGVVALLAVASLAMNEGG